jgi:hypothetical protein
MQTPTNLPRYEHYIAGRAVAPSSGEYLPNDDPFTGVMFRLVLFPPLVIAPMRWLTT